MTIRALTLDWGDTLAANYGMPYQAGQRRAFERLRLDLLSMGCASVPADITAWMADVSVQWRASIDREANPEGREFDFVGMMNGWLAAAGAMDADPHRIRAALHRCTAQLTDTVVPFAETAPTLALLKARGYRIGILSHVPYPGDACREWFARHGLAQYVDFWSLSCEIGWIKPNPRHFRHALDHAGVPAHEVLHVGDHPWRDIEGAKAHGMKTCLRRTEGIYAAEALDTCGPDAEILRLGELLRVAETL